MLASSSSSSSSQHSFPNIFSKGPKKGSEPSVAFAASTPTQPPGNGSIGLKNGQGVYNIGMIRPL
jgi:hypothetical protein